MQYLASVTLHNRRKTLNANGHPDVVDYPVTVHLPCISKADAEMVVESIDGKADRSATVGIRISGYRRMVILTLNECEMIAEEFNEHRPWADKSAAE